MMTLDFEEYSGSFVLDFFSFVIFMWFFMDEILRKNFDKNSQIKNFSVLCLKYLKILHVLVILVLPKIPQTSPQKPLTKSSKNTSNKKTRVCCF